MRMTITRNACVFVSALVACGTPHSVTSDGGASMDGTTTSVAVVSNEPFDGSTAVPLNGAVSATFSEAMDGGTLTSSTFTLTRGPTAIPVDGTVIYANLTAVFRPVANLEHDSSFTATITTSVRSAAGAAITMPYSWSFTTGDTVLGVPIDLRTAGNYAIFAWRAIDGSGATVTGDVGITPSYSNSISGFALSTPPTEYTTSSQIDGKVYARDYASPTPSKLAIVVNDLDLAIDDATGRSPTVIGVGGEIGGMTFAPGVYNWARVAITTDVTLAGSATDVWIFQVAETLNMAAGMNVVLTGGALPKNIFWQVTGAVTIGAGVQFNGVVLASAAFSSGANSSITGRLLSRTRITINDSVVVQPTP